MGEKNAFGAPHEISSGCCRKIRRHCLARVSVKVSFVLMKSKTKIGSSPCDLVVLALPRTKLRKDM